MGKQLKTFISGGIIIVVILAALLAISVLLVDSLNAAQAQPLDDTAAIALKQSNGVQAVGYKIIVSAEIEASATPTCTATCTLTLTLTPSETPSPEPSETAIPPTVARLPTSTPRPTVYVPPTVPPTPTETPRDSLADIITIGDCRAQAYHLGPEQTGLRGGMVAEMAMSLLWTTEACGDLPIARCMVEYFNPHTLLLALNDGGGTDYGEWVAGNQMLINHIREYEESEVRLFVIIGPTQMHVDNPFGAGVVVIDLLDVVERARAHGIQLLEPDNFHLRPIINPFEEEWQANYHYGLFYHLYYRAIAIGQGVVSIEEEFFASHPYGP